MDNLHLYNELYKVLRMEDRFCTDTGELIKSNIETATLNLSPELIRLLLGNDLLSRHFFADVDGVKVFDKVKFQHFIMNKQFLPDSYTSFKNKIGLTVDDGRFITDSREVVLAWPFKDCMLEGGQTKEDAKRNEIFWNETLAPDEINRLTEPKVLTAFKRYDKDGEHKVGHLSQNDNLIIKGNNLLALYSLKEKYAGRVKLIYIDPPYNTGSDDFGYNDNFNHSTWLTFMKNRLDVALHLLSNDGLIFVNIDDCEEEYLSVLMDSIFTRECRFDKISIKTSSSQGGFGDVNPGLISNTENILIYTKNADKIRDCFNDEAMYVRKDYDENYRYIITDWDTLSYADFNTIVYKSLNIPEPYNNQTWRELKKIYGEDYKQVLYNKKSELSVKYKDCLFRTFNPNKPSESLIQKLEESNEMKDQIVIDADSVGNTRYILNGEVVLFYSKLFKNVDGEYVPCNRLSTNWSDISWEGIAKEGGVKMRNGKKPEKLLQRIINISTKPGDIVLDFFSGSGTTAAVAMKLGRRFIACEQITKQIEISYKRICNVVKGDQTGISKAVNWQGGGSFVYCELSKANQNFVEQIEAATTKKALADIWQQMQQTGFLSYKINAKDIDDNAEAFEALSLDDQKRFLIECLDKNLLYVPLSDIDNADYNVDEEDKRLTREFYKKGV